MSWTMVAIIVIGLWVAVWICVGHFFDDEDPPEPGSHSFNDPQVGNRCVAADPNSCRWDACRACIGDPA